MNFSGVNEMANFKFLSAAERMGLSPDVFGDPNRRLFPILSQEDVDNAPDQIAVLENADEIKNRIKSIAQANGYTLPEGWSADFSQEDIPNESNFSVGLHGECLLTDKAETSDGEYVLRTGKIFEAGSYPDKKFEITPEEMLAAISKFKPVELDLEHMPTILDGKLGKLEAVALGEDGWSLIGTVRIPKKVDELLGDERKVSATWDRATKTIKKLALVRNPRVKDAALMAAFAADELQKSFKGILDEKSLMDTLEHLFEESSEFKDTWAGQSVLQDIHDMAARAGAICTEVSNSDSGEESEFVSEDESKRIQQIHDAAIRGGAKCRFKEGGADSSYYNDTENEEMAKDIKEILSDIKAYLEKDNSSSAEKASTDADTKVDNSTEAAVEEPAKVEAKVEPKIESKVEHKAEEEEEVINSDEPSAREIELEAELNRLKAEKIESEASKYAEELVREKKAFPADKGKLTAIFKQLMLDDASAEASIPFKDGDEEKNFNRVELLKTVFDAKPVHHLTDELADVEELFALHTEDGEFYTEEADKQAKAYVEKKKAEAAKARNK